MSSRGADATQPTDTRSGPLYAQNLLEAISCLDKTRAFLVAALETTKKAASENAA